MAFQEACFDIFKYYDKSGSCDKVLFELIYATNVSNK